jgi:hypothetical protein
VNSAAPAVPDGGIAAGNHTAPHLGQGAGTTGQAGPMPAAAQAAAPLAAPAPRAFGAEVCNRLPLAVQPQQAQPLAISASEVVSGNKNVAIANAHCINWMYPTNKSERGYQASITETAMFENTLVCLPTGLGKTFIAAVIMYNFYRCVLARGSGCSDEYRCVNDQYEHLLISKVMRASQQASKADCHDNVLSVAC